MIAAHFLITKCFLCVSCPSPSVGLVTHLSAISSSLQPHKQHISPWLSRPLIVRLLFHLLYAAHTDIQAKPVACLRNVSDVIYPCLTSISLCSRIIAHLLTCRKSHSRQAIVLVLDRHSRSYIRPKILTSNMAARYHSVDWSFQLLTGTSPLFLPRRRQWHDTTLRWRYTLRNALFYRGVILSAGV